jgi:hypothetical protein
MLELKVVLNVHVSTGEPALSVARFIAELEKTLGRSVREADIALRSAPPPAPETDPAPLRAPAVPAPSLLVPCDRRPCGCALRGPHRSTCRWP